jgi:hypothetical protein
MLPSSMLMEGRDFETAVGQGRRREALKHGPLRAKAHFSHFGVIGMVAMAWYGTVHDMTCMYLSLSVSLIRYVS